LSRLQANEITVEEILSLEYVPREIIAYLRENSMLTFREAAGPEQSSG
jgi:hypothetical protein